MRRETCPSSVRLDPIPPETTAAGPRRRACRRGPARGAAPRYLEGLNDEQRRAVEALDGPVLVLAGAGVGKTRVLTTRIAHLIATGRARPHEILAVTFTNKAAREMRERVGALTGVVEGMPWMGTFHSIGAKILRRHAELVGLKPNFTILDTDDQIRLLKQILQAENIDDKRWPARALASLIDALEEPRPRSRARSGRRSGRLRQRPRRRALQRLSGAAEGAQRRRFRRPAARKPAPVSRARRKSSRSISSAGATFWSTNTRTPTSSSICGCGCSRRAHRNLCCVGDDDQSIYGWRGADVDNILRFERDFPGATVIRLERNYRSGGHILAVAAGLIAHNRNRLGKTLYTERRAGREADGAAALWDSQEEARVIGDEIEAAQRAGVPLDEMAILVRASFQMREFEERFIALGMPYQGDRRPAVLRAGGNPRRARLSALRRPARRRPRLRAHLQLPRRGLGEATLNLLHAYRPQRRRFADARGARAGRERGAQGAAAPDPARPAARLRALVGADRQRRRTKNSPRRSSRRAA